MDSRIPATIAPLLTAYRTELQTRVPQLIHTVYIGGSIALEEYTPPLSDIDFVTVLQRQATTDELRHLESIHATIANHYPQAPLSGSYVVPEMLGKQDHETPPHPYFHEGMFHNAGHFEINLVTWWVLKHYGIQLLGSSAPTLEYAVDWDELQTAMHTNLNTYWHGWTVGRQAILGLSSDEGVQWAVTGVLRQYYSFHESAITTKLRAAHYALEHMPAHWHRIINEAIRLRQGSQPPLYKWRVVRMLEAVSFIKCVILESNAIYSRMH